MQKTYLVLVVLLFHSFLLSGFTGNEDEPTYSIVNINPELLVNANSIIRNKKTIVELNYGSQISIKEFVVRTVLQNSTGNESGVFIPYDSFSKLSDIDCRIYDAYGKFIRRLKNSEISDYSAFSYSTLFSDNRVKYLNPVSSNLPFTIAYSYTMRISDFITPPPWFAVSQPFTSIENATLQILNETNNGPLVYKAINSDPPVLKLEDHMTIYQWKYSNFKAVKNELQIPDSIIVFPKVFYHMNIFHIDDTRGRLTSWSEFGDYFYRLDEKSDKLSEEAVQEINKRIEGSKSDSEKIKLLYNWMQSQTRYVSIQEGIGGWKSFDAEYVYTNKLGDCKALVNYMKAVLKIAGIYSYPVIISAGENSNFVYEDFPFNYFNHVILCIPNIKDTIWLECTSQNQPFNFLGSFTSNRTGLLIKGKESKLVRTTVYSDKTNYSNLKGEITIQPNGYSSGQVSRISSGELQEKIRYFHFNASEKEKNEWVREEISVSDFKLISFNFLNTNKDSIYDGYRISFESSSISAITGSRLFIHTNLLNTPWDEYRFDDSRTNPFEIKTNSVYNDTIIYYLPSGYTPETKDKYEKITSELGEFEYQIRYDSASNSYSLITAFKQNLKIITSAKYSDCAEFHKKIINLSKKTIVSKKI